MLEAETKREREREKERAIKTERERHFVNYMVLSNVKAIAHK